VIALEAAADAPVERVGAKARMLSSALRHGLPVPAGAVLAPDDAAAADALGERLGDGPYAVRSSAAAEDAGELSWAGQFESILPVEPAALEAAIDAVRVSGGSDRARAYGGGVAGPIPVLVQPVVAAVAAGVAFSLDPANGDEHHCVIEAVRGLGTALTDGAVTPARWRVAIDTGAAEGPSDGPLSAAALASVARLTIEVAEWLGYPCDVEWAWDGERTWLLQARPITAATWRPAEGQWTSANVGETMPGVVTPLTASITLEDEFARSIDASLVRLGVARSNEVVTEGGRFYGHAYWRVDVIKERMLGLPGFVERKVDETMGIAPTYEGDGRRSPTNLRTIRNAVPAARALWTMYRREGPAAQAFAGEVDHDEAAWLALRWDDLSEGALHERVAAARELRRRTNHHAITINFLAEQAQDFVRELLETATSKLEPEADSRVLLLGLEEPPTAAATARLEALARRHADAREAIVAAASADDLAPALGQELRAAIDEFGWMAAADDELALPRWDEDEELPLALFKAAARATEAPAGAASDGFEQWRRAEEERVLAAAGLLRPVLRPALRLARRYQTLREELRVTVARANRILRRALLALGRRAAAAGVLAVADDVFWLTAGESERLRRGQLPADEARRAVAARRRHALRFRNWDPPSLLGAEPARAAAGAHDGAVLAGVPCSSGVVRGRVAVLRRLESVGSVEPGAILVLKHGNPGWTPAFVVASALVTEEGGLLSHSSVIARERGLPTVINVPGATEVLSDGQLVEVDGGRGVVTLLDG
jgi:pyruvate,water dikinase